MSAGLTQRLLSGSWIAGIAALGLSASAAAEEPVQAPVPTRNLFGMTGLIDLPSADMQPDGEFAVTAGYFGGFLRTTASFQFLPWMEVAYRYSAIRDFFPGQDSTLFDRSFDLKIRFVEETDRWPAVAFGLQDFLGTGIYASEYFVATKGFGAGEWGDFRLTGGIGWGRFADVNSVNNPLCTIPDSEVFCTRGGFSGSGGTANFGNYFSGNLGFFGGLEWYTPVDGLVATVEYSPDRYVAERRNGDFQQNGQINVGLEYQPVSGVEIGAYYMYGSEFGVRLTLSGNPFRPLSDADLEPGPLPLEPREAPEPGRLERVFGRIVSIFDSEPPEARVSDPRLRDVVLHTRLGTVRWAEAMLTERAGDVCPEDLARAIDAELGLIDVVTFSREGEGVVCTVALRPAGEAAVRITARSYADYPTDWYKDAAGRQEIVARLADELQPDSIGLVGIEIAPTRVQVYIENRRFRQMPRAIGRTARALARVMPPSVETFAITPVERSLPVATIVLERSSLEDQVERPDAARRTWATATVADARPVDWSEVMVDDLFPRFSWQISPAAPVSLFDPDQPVRFDLSVVTAGSVEFLPGLSANAAVSKRIVGDLDDIERKSDSQVEHVRSDIAEYLREGDPALVRLTLDYLTKLDEDVYGRVTLGLLERMYGGVSGEVLWKPATQDWGVGLELNYVKQRDFESRFAFRDYEVATGHASLYLDTDFHDLSFQVDAGRYLAGDWGTTFTVKRRFDTGWELGAFATFTTIGFDEFGEGSFDKGIYLTIPFDWVLPYESRSAFSTVLRPLTRDGGQRVEVANRLYNIVEDNDAGGYHDAWGSFWQ